MGGSQYLREGSKKIKEFKVAGQARLHETLS